jgi:hypothetical protein
MVANWLAHRVVALKKQVHLNWEYSGTQDLNYEVNHPISKAKLKNLLK